MPTLAELAAKQKEAANAKPESESPAAPATPADDAGAKRAAPAGLAFLKAAAKSESISSAPQPAQPAAKASGVGGLAFLRGRNASQGAGDSAAAGSDDAGQRANEPSDHHSEPGTSGTAAGASESGRAAGSDLDLASLMESEAGGDPTVAAVAGFKSRFADETPADAPLRQLEETDDAAADKLAKQFVESLDMLYKSEVMHDPELLGNVVRSIMTELSNHKEYRKLIQPDDVHMIVRGMRESMGLARVRKEESAAKRKGGGAKKGKTVSADALSALEGLLDIE